MLGSFTYCNPTKLYFGKDALDGLNEELPKYGKRVLLVYGGGSIKKNGIYGKVVEILKANDKEIYEDAGVMPNPTHEKLNEGVARARAAKADLILAVGGGSVITNHKQKLKIGHVFGENVFPKFSVMNPEFTYSLPEYQMVSGIYDIMCHILEQYFSGTDDNTSDYVMEGLLRSLIHSADIAVENPADYEARSNIMWTATWALNTFVAKGKATDWMVHMLGQAVAAHTDATHGMTLATVSMPYYRYILPYGTEKFARYAVAVWGVNPEGKTQTQTAYEGLERMESWMKKIGLVMNITELGATPDMLDGIVNSTKIMTGGYKVLDGKDIRAILKASY